MKYFRTGHTISISNHNTQELSRNIAETNTTDLATDEAPNEEQ